MKRDDDYIRQMLFDIESSDEPYFLAPAYISMSPEDEKKHQHAELLCDAGFLHQVGDGVYRMTNQGHDYLAVIRSNQVWEKTKEGAAAIGGASLGIIRDLAVAYVKKEAATKLGIDLG
ncbi:uncharacterized protein DUF2513 [Breoghania corrubedonensis]|uniref:Uncharacterized protein DUF2513 n=1 Tax=Breoghania corrubedonensis TaxID=665038 RepID=A0A2T5VD58_9HYPH|nr:DUF2513 domain-containing protein [Breoghania corrubedonensis]PTW61672.1 uncharacterized protein DUF2513 [Breoghania corrubedonensis]